MGSVAYEKYKCEEYRKNINNSQDSKRAIATCNFSRIIKLICLGKRVMYMELEIDIRRNEWKLT